ncbi:MAG: hypothetical protein MRY74_04720 [Neomegalonema sp.]|nr:hypothetical protein [Neomegalonema sp.]
MSIKLQFAALSDALAEELQSFTAYAMASMVGYGRVGGYTPGYLALKHDIFAFFEICAATLEQPDFRRAYKLRRLVVNRMMVERFFEDERNALADALDSMSLAIDATTETSLEAQLRAAQPDLTDRFGYLLRRAGVPAPRRRRDAEQRPALPAPVAAAHPTPTPPARAARQTPILPVRHMIAQEVVQRAAQAPCDRGVIELSAVERELATRAMFGAASQEAKVQARNETETSSERMEVAPQLRAPAQPGRPSAANAFAGGR